MNRQIETLRGFACVLLVLYHVIGADPSNGLRVNEGPVRLMNDALAYVRMPLFTFLSGMVYGLRPFGGDTRRFVIGKCRRLLIPMFVVGTLFAIVQALTPGANAVVANWWLLHIVPVAHFWFVESLFWVFLVILLAESYRMIRTPVGLGLAFALSAALYLSVRGTHFFSIDGAIYLLPYFLAGLAITRFDLWPRLEQHWIQALLLLLALLAVWQLGVPVPNPDRRTGWMLLAGIALCCLCLAPRVELQWLARIGMSSYAIYLFHVFFTAASRIALAKVGLSVQPLQITAGLVVGVAGPMLINHYASRYRWPALLLLGKSVSRTRQAGAVQPAD
jgi:peptidoglycan/LPS O-acetylase OafA/YrhL